jgi:hypothetical protein
VSRRSPKQKSHLADFTDHLSEIDNRLFTFGDNQVKITRLVF